MTRDSFSKIFFINSEEFVFNSIKYSNPYYEVRSWVATRSDIYDSYMYDDANVCTSSCYYGCCSGEYYYYEDMTFKRFVLTNEATDVEYGWRNSLPIDSANFFDSHLCEFTDNSGIYYMTMALFNVSKTSGSVTWTHRYLMEDGAFLT